MPDPQPVAPKLGIIVVNYASSEMIRDNLEPLALNRSNTTVVIVDNYATDNERSAAKRLSSEHDWELILPEDNVGFGSGMNLGVSHALEQGCTEILLLNPDVTLTPESLSRLWEHARSSRDSILSPTILRPDGSTWFAGGQIDMATGATRTRPSPGLQPSNGWLTGACLMMSAEAWRTSGGFDDRYFMYWEDIDLTRRFAARGGTLEVLADIEAVHAVGATQGSERKSNLYTYFVCRNRLLFASTHLDRQSKFKWLLRTPSASWAIAMREGRRSALRRPSYMFATLRGTLAGVGLVLRSVISR